MKINIKTITPIHVGSGNELQGNFEYLYFREEKKVAVIDAEKVLGILGEDNISQWVACIDNKQSLLPLIQQRKPNVKAEDVALRIIPMQKGTEKPIRTHLQTGSGHALLPGTSLKGAMRTAVWAAWIIDNPETVQDTRNLKDFRQNWSDASVSRAVFGSDPNHDIFRLLQVGDAEFKQTETYETNVINYYKDHWDLKNEITQFVEAIPAGINTTTRLLYNDLLLKRVARDYFNRQAAKLEINTLFPLINKHTLRLIDDEISFWGESQGNPEALSDYVEEMERIQSIATDCAQNECVIRLGWGSGFRSMTGDWHGSMDQEEYYRLVKSLRPKHPDDLTYPKTMRFIRGGKPLGFIKLSF
jgi:CRISPR-associated protein Csm5